MIRAENITLSAKDKKILKDVSLEILPGILTAVIGPNGSGKTSLLNCLSGNIKPSSGRIYIQDKELAGMDAEELSNSRAVVSQHYPSDIPFTPRKIISLPMDIYEKDDKLVFEKAVEMLGVSEYLDRPYTKLSGGEKQRVQIARALVQYLLSEKKDYILMLDEPGSGLDIGAASAFGGLMRTLLSGGLGVLWVLHDINMALDIADRIIIVKEGRATLIEDISELYDGRLLAQTYGVELDRYRSSSGGSKLHPRWG
jgi:iron complex transport system ATP-binding protein